MPKLRSLLSIGDVARRTGASVSAIRFYEDKGLLTSERNSGGQRRFQRSDLRRLSFILVAQKLGLSLADIRSALETLPGARTPTKADWSRLSREMRETIDARIGMLERLRDRLDGCIGCGCLSLDVCQLYNPEDQAAETGAGARFVFSSVQVPERG